jgi:para-aminobenzoate synthetase component 1
MLIEEIKNTSALDALIALKPMPLAFMLSNWRFGDSSYSYVSGDPFLTLSSDNPAEKDPFKAISDAISGYRADCRRRMPFPFSGGACGYFSYDLKDHIEPFGRALLKRRGKGLDMPYSIMGLYDPLFVYCHKDNTGHVVSASRNEKRFERFCVALRNAEGASKSIAMASGSAKAVSFTSNLTKGDYIRAVQKAQDYISRGDIYQINLSHRLSIKWDGDALSLFKGLLDSAPAPFSSFLDFGAFQIISNSPERLLKIEKGIAETMPIKGTRPRGKDMEEDQRMIKGLKSSPKERAEHVMIVDLERNDLGRICEPRTVEVKEFEALRTYPHLHHMVSTVAGRLKKGIDQAGALKAMFPGGSVTGAPKKRALEIIDELETVPRGVYTGGIGWMDFGGDMDIAMAIRTAVHSKGALYLSVGSGIVADSEPSEEYEETMVKARDFFKALGIA